MTREEYEINTWQAYFEEAERFHMFEPSKFADRKTAEHMRHVALRNRVPWDTE